MIRRSWIQRYSALPPQEDRYLVLQSWDTASKGGPENDFSACSTWIVTKDRRWFLCHVWRKRVDYPTLKATIIGHARQWNAQRVLIEDAGSGIDLFQELRGKVSGVVAIRPDKDKITRMAAVCATFEAGLVYLPERAPWLADFETELFTFPGSKHDDQCDSVSQALSNRNTRFPLVISDKVLARADEPGLRSSLFGPHGPWGGWR